MSPAAVDIKSSVTIKTSSSVPNPNPTPFSFANIMGRDPPDSMNSNSALSSTSDRIYDFGVGDGNRLRSGPGRGRPRMTKLRKQIGKSRAGARDSAAEFNPFRTKLEDLCPVNSASSNVSFSTNGVLDHFNRLSDEVFVSKDCSFVCNENVAPFTWKPSDNYLSSANSKKVEESSFVFGAENRDVKGNMHQPKVQLFENTANAKCGAEERESKGKPENLDNMGFVFVGNMGDVRVDLNSERKENNYSVVESGSNDEEKARLENESDRNNDGNVWFPYAANNFCLNLNLEKGETCESVEKPSLNNISCFFGVNQSDSISSSNSEKGKCNRNVCDSGLGFLFGTSWHNGKSRTGDQEESDSGKNIWKSRTGDQGEMKVSSETKPEKVEATEVRYDSNGSMSRSENYVFVFGSGNKKCSSTDKVNLNNKDFGNSISRRTENDNLHSNVNNKNKYVPGSGTDKVASSLSTDPAFKLPDEMKKLNINQYESVANSDKKKDSSKNLHAKEDASFVFSSSSTVKPSSCSDSSSDPTQRQKSDPAASVERVVVDNLGTDINDHILSGNSGSRDGSLLGSQKFTLRAELDKSSCKVNSDTQTNSTTASSARLDSQPNDNGQVGGQRKGESCPSTLDGSRVSFPEFITPNWDPISFKANLYCEPNKNVEFNVKTRSKKDKRPKGMRGNIKQSSSHKQRPKQVDVLKQNSTQENQNSPECCSPMDFSPYMEPPVDDKPFRETSVTSNESYHPDNIGALYTSHSNPSVSTNTKDGNLTAAERIDINLSDQNPGEPNEKSLHLDGNCPLETYIFGAETACSSSKGEQVYSSIGAKMTSAKDGDGFNTLSYESVQHCSVEDQKYYTFSASPSAEGKLTSRKSQLRKNRKKKVVKVSSSSVPFSPHTSTLLFNTVHGQEEDKFSTESKGNISESAEQVNQRPMSPTAVFQEACEMWRLRGNLAYKSGCMSKAEDLYSQGINSIRLSETSGCCIKPLVLCYSNRAAARISLGKIREALEDCIMAAAMDSHFLKVYVRAANCHLLLGEVENAMKYYNKLLESGADLCLDRRITIEAADGLQKAQKVAECTNRSAALLEQNTMEAASEALESITEALSTSSCSENLLEMKGEALCLLRKYEDAVQLCEQTLSVAEKNFASVGIDDCLVNINASATVNYPIARLWRWRLISKSYFYMGKLEAACDVLQKLEQVGPISNRQGKKILESSKALDATIRELLRCKNAGNEAFRSGKYTEAVEHYTIALSSNVESRPFAAICFCNRAAAHQALGHIADAIADCSLAMALDGNYTKAISRRAVLHEMIRDHAQAASDLQRLATILEKQTDEKVRQSASSGRSTSSKEIKQAHRRMSFMEEEAKEGVPLDFYLILGVKASDTASDIKKAYRKAALKHHPDKASQFLARTESGDEGRLWKEIADEVHKDADRLFKMIGEAYAILSDTTKRSEYDREEEMRKAVKEMRQSGSYGRKSDAYSYSYRSGSKQNWHNWKTYGNSHSRW